MAEFFLALLAGMVTVGGPCILPLLPIVLGTGVASRHPLRPVAIVFGFTLSFTLFALLFSAFGSLLGLTPNSWRILSSIIIAAFGLMMLFPRLQAALFARLEPVLSRLTPKNSANNSDIGSGFLLGLTLGAVWTPCAGPVLGSILTLIAAKRELSQSASLLFGFALGAGIPMLLISYGGRYAANKVRAINKYTEIIQRLFGALIILVAIGLLTQTDVYVQTYLLTHYPSLFIGTKLGL